MLNRIRTGLKSVLPRQLVPVARSTFWKGRRLYGSLAYRGDQVSCPCCGWTGKAFLPARNRDNAMCPRCVSAERHRFLWLQVNRRSDLFPPDSRVLHFAPEAILRNLIQSREGIEYVSADLYRDDVDVKVDITDMPFKDGSFDVIVCNHVMEHVDDESRALSEMLRVLSDKGVAIVQVPVYDIPVTFEDPSVTSPDAREEIYGQDDHVRKYGRDVKSRFEGPGVHVNVLSPADLPAEEIEKYGLMSADGVNREDIFLCSRAS